MSPVVLDKHNNTIGQKVGGGISIQKLVCITGPYTHYGIKYTLVQLVLCPK